MPECDSTQSCPLAGKLEELIRKAHDASNGYAQRLSVVEEQIRQMNASLESILNAVQGGGGHDARLMRQETLVEAIQEQIHTLRTQQAKSDQQADQRWTLVVRSIIGLCAAALLWIAESIFRMT